MLNIYLNLLYSIQFSLQGVSSCSENLSLSPGTCSSPSEALIMVEKTIYCATVDQQDNILQVYLLYVPLWGLNTYV